MRALLILLLACFIHYGQAQNYLLQILHASDLEGGVEALETAPNFAAIVDELEDEYPNSLLLSAGDNYILGPFFAAASDEQMEAVFRETYSSLLGDDFNAQFLQQGDGRVDISIMNILDFDASCLGNHELDPGPDVLKSIIAKDITSDGKVKWIGSQFPYLSCNLDFGSEASLAPIHNKDLLSAEDYRYSKTSNNKKIAPYTFIEKSGEKIGIVGVTTPLIESISSPGNIKAVSTSNDPAEIAKSVQPYVDELISKGINKIILLSHLQQVQIEMAMARFLKGVDIIVAGGSDAIFANESDRLRPEDKNSIVGGYPYVAQDESGNTTLIVSTNGEYSYLGRLIVEFDQNGNVITESGSSSKSGPVVCDDQMVSELYDGDLKRAFAKGSKGKMVKDMIDKVTEIVVKKDGNIVGRTAVFLEGRKAVVRTEETNLGNLTADANLYLAKQVDPEVKISLKNGGGIRASIGTFEKFGNGEYLPSPPLANPVSGKKNYEISQLDIENSLRFNNDLSIVSVTADDLRKVLEHAIDEWAEGEKPGAFPQLSGLTLIFDPTFPKGTKVRYVGLLDENDVLKEPIVIDGAVVGNPRRLYKLVTLDFLADGGNNYPFPDVAMSRTDLKNEELEEGAVEFAPPYTEQDALAEYLKAIFYNQPYDFEDTAPREDRRIKNIARMY